MEVKKLDVEEAFLSSEINEETYIDLPKGWNEIERVEKSNVVRINADLYGLSQASRVFYYKFMLFIINELVLNYENMTYF